MAQRIIELLKIFGAEDCSENGAPGVLVTEGASAIALLESTGGPERIIGHHRGKLVRISR
ncbi:hypothetical protein LXA47_23615 [Massilia sp. P8910]|uniref:hypothetical protein n=1 Tax=Massilia antarctica TaxID=2765360 RepID=UPI001E38567C|nr:hypothetical protein [Massilia antarctica]MCE3606568.1 hypothetical protein [Massilia antarctica]